MYSTYLGGSGADYCGSIAVDSSGNAYVAGTTDSTNFPTTSAVYNRTYGGGGYDAFVVKMSTGPARTVSPVLVIPYGYLPTGTPVTAVFMINVVGVYPSDGEEQLFTDLEHPNWTYTIIVNGVQNLRPVIEGNSLSIGGFELSYKPSDVVSVHVTLEGDAPVLDPPLTNFTVVKVQSLDSRLDVVPGSVVTIGGQTTATHLPVTDFTGTPTSGTAPLMVIFQDISTNFPSSWNWSFGDGTLFNYSGLVPLNPIHSYTDYGTYTVSLTTTNAMGSTTITKSGYIMVSNATTQIGVFRNSTGDWYLEYNKTGVVDKTFHFGKSGDVPVAGDWNKNGVPDYGVFRPSNGNWYLETTKTGIVNTTFHFGKSGDIPVTGDWNSDGASDAGVFRPSNGNWYLETTKTGIVNTTFHFGKIGDIPVVGDWDGNGTSDIGVFRPSTGHWYLDYNKTGVVDKAFQFGKAGDTPIAGSTSPIIPPIHPSKTITFNQNLTITPGTTVSIPVGGKVIWKNDDPLKPHGLAAVDAQGVKYFGGLTGVQIPYNNIFEVTFDTVGSFDYKTTFEPETTGRVIVTMY